MQIKRTIPIIIEEIQEIKELVSEFTRYKQVISPIAFNDGKILSAVELHNTVYHHIDNKLNAQMRCSAIRSVIAAYTSAKSNKRPAGKPFIFKRKSALFLFNKDFSFTRNKELLSITSSKGRIKIPYRIPEYAQKDFQEAVAYNSITANSEGKLKLCITLEVPEPSGKIPVGIDLGATNALVASTENDTLFISGKEQKVLNQKTRKVRQRLQTKLSERKAQKKDTHSVRRVLKRLARKQSNRSRTFCRETAAKLCKWAPENNVLVFEDLKIKQVRKGRKQRKGTNRKLSQWFYGMMINACSNRAARNGIAISFVDPAYTSQRCNKCGQIGNRRGHKFTCSCGYTSHADINASHNIRLTFTVLRNSGLHSTSPETLMSNH